MSSPFWQSGKFDEAVDFLDVMIARGCSPSSEMFNVLLDTCIRGKRTAKVSVCLFAAAALGEIRACRKTSEHFVIRSVSAPEEREGGGGRRG